MAVGCDSSAHAPTAPIPMICAPRRGGEARNERVPERELAPLPELTPHSLDGTFCSLLYAPGEPLPVALAEMGHTDPALALRSMLRRCVAVTTSRRPSGRPWTAQQPIRAPRSRPIRTDGAESELLSADAEM